MKKTNILLLFGVALLSLSSCDALGNTFAKEEDKKAVKKVVDAYVFPNEIKDPFQLDGLVDGVTLTFESKTDKLKIASTSNNQYTFTPQRDETNPINSSITIKFKKNLASQEETYNFTIVPLKSDLEDILASFVFPKRIKNKFSLPKTDGYGYNYSFQTTSENLIINEVGTNFEFSPIRDHLEDKTGLVYVSVSKNNVNASRGFEFSVINSYLEDLKAVRTIYDSFKVKPRFNTNQLLDLSSYETDGVNIDFTVSNTEFLKIGEADGKPQIQIIKDPGTLSYNFTLTMVITKNAAKITKYFDMTLVPTSDTVSEEYSLGTIKFEEAEGFVASTSYNNSNEKEVGNPYYPFYTIQGAVSKTYALSDSMSIQNRYYQNSSEVTPSFRTGFLIKNVDSISFKTKAEQSTRIDILKSNDGIDYSQVTYKNLDAGVNYPDNSFDIEVGAEGAFLKVALSSVTGAAASSYLVIDDLTFKSSETTASFVSLKNDGLDDGELGGYSGYYSDLSYTLTSDLEENLQSLIRKDTTIQTYEYAKQGLIASDRATSNPNKTYGIYDSVLHNPVWDGGSSWQREHVWPCSRMRIGGVDRPSEGTRSNMSDLHNLRVISNGVNQSRSNRYFSATGASSSYDPGVAHRGDVARILFYMATMYDELTLVENPETYISDTTKYYFQMGSLSELLAWHIEDPVDQFEIQRNEKIYGMQGNRNPYIDYPEFAQYVFN